MKNTKGITEDIVEAVGLTKTFNSTLAVDNLSFTIKRGEILGLLGPNGAGKTTTMHMLLGLTTPTSGKVRIFGLDSDKDREEILGRVNFSSSYVSLPYSLTIRENLTVFAKLYEVKDAKRKIPELMEVFNIKDIQNEPTRRLSSGQITRVSLAKALLNDPEVLFLDEPTASLDPDMAERTRCLLMNLNKDKGMTILYTSHNMVETEEICDRVIFLDKGRIIAEGAPTEVTEKFGSNTLEEAFLKIARRDKDKDKEVTS